MSRRAKATLQAKLRHVGGGELVQGECGEYSFPRHHHDSYTIGLVTRGREFITTRGATHRLSRGSLYFSNPLEAHDGRSFDEEGWSFMSFYVSPETVTRLTTANEPLFQHFMIESGKLSSRAARAFTALLSSRCGLEIDSAILALLNVGLSQTSVGGAGGQRKTKPGKLKRARDYLDAHYAGDVLLADLAELTNLHPRHLIAAFKDYAGITPHAYLTARRVNAAFDAIRSGTPIAQAAASCGFYDQSHLHRHFKRMIGVTPDAVARAFKE